MWGTDIHIDMHVIVWDDEVRPCRLYVKESLISIESANPRSFITLLSDACKP